MCKKLKTIHKICHCHTSNEMALNLLLSKRLLFHYLINVSFVLFLNFFISFWQIQPVLFIPHKTFVLFTCVLTHRKFYSYYTHYLYKFLYFFLFTPTLFYYCKFCYFYLIHILCYYNNCTYIYYFMCSYFFVFLQSRNQIKLHF
jgi:hypothetical protein